MRSGIQGNPIVRRQTPVRVALLIVATFGGSPLATWAQTSGSGSTPAYPSKPVRYIVPFGAGAAPDTVARIVTDKLYSDYTSVLRMPEIQQRLDDLGVSAAPMTTTDFEQFIRAETTRWAKVIKDAAIPQQ